MVSRIVAIKQRFLEKVSRLQVRRSKVLQEFGKNLAQKKAEQIKRSMSDQS